MVIQDVRCSKKAVAVVVRTVLDDVDNNEQLTGVDCEGKGVGGWQSAENG